MMARRDPAGASGSDKSQVSPERRAATSLSIAFIVWEFPMLSETFILNLITGLIDRGHEVDIYALDGPPVDMALRHPDVDRYRLLERTCYAPRVPRSYARRAAGAVRLLLAHGRRNPAMLLRALNVFRHGAQAASLRLLYATVPFLGDKRYDIVHCQFGTIGLQGLMLRDVGALSGKMVTSFRGYDISQYLQEFGDDVYARLFRAGDFFLTNCDYFRRRLVALGCDEDKVLVHRSGIDCSRFPFAARRPSAGPVRVLTTGRLAEKKGIEYAIRAMATVAPANPGIEYRVIGDGPLRGELQRLIHELKLDGVVTLLGQRHLDDIIAALAATDIFIAPSVTASDGNQDAPVNTLKEAMAMGVPVIATHHGGIPELVEDGVSGFLVPERDAAAIADRLTHLIEHPDIRAPMGLAGRRYVQEHYDLHRLNDSLVEIYRRLPAGAG